MLRKCKRLLFHKQITIGLGEAVITALLGFARWASPLHTHSLINVRSSATLGLPFLSKPTYKGTFQTT